MRLIIKENDEIKNGVITYAIDDLMGSIKVKVRIEPKSFSVTPTNHKSDNSLISEFTLHSEDVKSCMSMSYKRGSVIVFGGYKLIVTSKDCASVKCAISCNDNDMRGEVLLDTHGIFVLVWRLDLEYTTHTGKKIRLRCIHG